MSILWDGSDRLVLVDTAGAWSHTDGRDREGRVQKADVERCWRSDVGLVGDFH